MQEYAKNTFFHIFPFGYDLRLYKIMWQRFLAHMDHLKALTSKKQKDEKTICEQSILQSYFINTDLLNHLTQMC